MNNDRIYSLQIIRALAVWLVVFHHIALDLLGHDQPTSGFWLFFAVHGSLGVDIFFVLSGFVIALIHKNYRDRPATFLARRLLRVVPNYWFYTVLIALSLVVLPPGTFFTTEFSFDNMLLSLVLIPHENLSGYGYFPILTAGWTLHYELFFYLTFAVAIAFAGGYAAYLTTAILLLVIALVKVEWVPNFLGNNIFLLSEFLIGMVVYHYWLKAKHYFWSNLVLVLMAFVAIAALWHWLGFSGYIRLLLAGPIVFIAVVLNHLLNPAHRLAKALIFLGDISFSTYLANLLVIAWVYQLMGLLPVFSSHLFAILVIVATFCLWCMTWIMVEKVFINQSLPNVRVPIQQLLKGGSPL